MGTARQAHEGVIGYTASAERDAAQIIARHLGSWADEMDWTCELRVQHKVIAYFLYHGTY